MGHKIYIATIFYLVFFRAYAFANDLLPTPITIYTPTNDTVFDEKTGLRWQRCSVGMIWHKDNRCLGKPRKFTFEQARRLNIWSSGPLVEWIELNSMWRVPTKNELQTLVDMTQETFKINTKFFPDINENTHSFWTSDMHSGGQAWYTDFRGGYTGFISGDHIDSGRKLNVRLVHVER